MTLYYFVDFLIEMKKFLKKQKKVNPEDQNEMHRIYKFFMIKDLLKQKNVENQKMLVKIAVIMYVLEK